MTGHFPFDRDAPIPRQWDDRLIGTWVRFQSVLVNGSVALITGRASPERHERGLIVLVCAFTDAENLGLVTPAEITIDEITRILGGLVPGE